MTKIHPPLMFFSLCLLVFVYTHTQAQVTPPEIRTMLPEKGIYRFNSFSEGSMIFRNREI